MRVTNHGFYPIPDCLFKICPTNKYLAQKQLASVMSRQATLPSSIDEDFDIQQLKHAAALERKQNEQEGEKMLGTELTYGCTIQVRGATDCDSRTRRLQAHSKLLCLL